MGDKHIVVENVEGTTTGRWHTDETYKVSDKVAQELGDMKKPPTGPDLRSWLQDHGGVLDDDGDKPAKVAKKNDGSLLKDHYKNGEFVKSDYVQSKEAKEKNHAGAELFLALITGGASLFIPHNLDEPAAADSSKFAKGQTPPEKPAADKKAPATTATAVPLPKPKP